jgi:hypothetical protein
MISINSEGFDELQRKLKDMVNPHGEFLKKMMLDKIFENVPEALAEREKVSAVDTEDAFQIVCTGLTPDIHKKVQEYIDSISTRSLSE